jgi:catechol 2,3-dioxygenase-like lactoylglutathione lyase family enzyme
MATTQTTPADTPASTVRPVMNAIDIVVSDLEAAMSFYRRLGLEFQVDATMPEHAQCDLSNGLHLMLDTEGLRGPTVPGWTRATGGPGTFFAFQFDSPADVDRTYAELTGAGYRGLKEPWDAFWGMRYATVADPDGNGVDLYANLPTT